MAGTDGLEPFFFRGESEMKDSGILTPISVAEFIDKITILRIKAERIKDVDKLKNVNQELGILNQIKAESLETRCELSEFEERLKIANEMIWTFEDQVREHEHRHDFGASFVSLARSIYRANDQRALLKRQINDLMGSCIIEEKSYTEY